MMERNDKRYVSCPVCGRHLMKCQGECNIEVTCGKCNRDIEVIVEDDKVIVLENRREAEASGKGGQVKVSVSKQRKDTVKRAVNY